jgi:phage terminase small subunit
MLADEAVGHLEHDGQVDAGGKTSPWVRVAGDHAKSLSTLAGKLRLSPSSRTRPEAHSLQQRPALAKPWEWGDRDPSRDLDDDLLAK